MTKQEFLTVLRGQITGSIPTSEVESQINYYEAFIDGQMSKGMTEEDATAELGDPRLIAKTLIESTNRAAEAAGYDGPYRSSIDSYEDSDGINNGAFGKSSSSSYSRSSSNSQSQYSGRASSNNSQGPAQKSAGSGCSGIIIALLIILVLIGLLVFSIIRFTFRNFGTILIIAGIVAGVVFLVRSIRGRR